VSEGGAVSGWAPLWPVNGSLLHVRVTASLLGRVVPRACPEFLAAKAHPEVFPRPERYVPRRYHRFETFTLGLVVEAVKLVESGQLRAAADEAWSAVAVRAVAAAELGGAARGEVHPAARRWATYAVATYLETSETLAQQHAAAGGSPLRLDELRALGHQRDGAVREVAVWGLAYASEDGRTRELRTLRLRSPSAARPRTAQEVATYAAVTANGRRVLEGGAARWSDPFEVALADPEPDLVRVVDVGLGDGSTVVLWEGTPHQAQSTYGGVARPLVPAVTDGGTPVPQRSCAECKVRPVCTELPTRPGLLGLPDQGTHPRVLAPSKLWTYQVCPAKYLLTTDLRLPAGPREQTASMVRGTRVHRWLEQAHLRGFACGTDDLPADGGGLGDEAARLAAGAGLDPSELRDVVPWLAQHVVVCPFAALPDVAASVPERDVVVDDTDADVLVVTRPDLLLATPAGPVWRETKTLAVMPTLDDLELLPAYPQAAVGVCALADRAVTDPTVMSVSGPAPGAVELELLTATGARLVRYDAGDEATVLAARRALAEATYAWHQDDEFPTRPGTACAFCEVAQWCPDANADPVGATVQLDGLTFDTTTGELVGAPAEASSPRAVGLASSVLGAPAEPGDDEDIPF
jgi:hypothetical protein